MQISFIPFLSMLVEKGSTKKKDIYAAMIFMLGRKPKSFADYSIGISSIGFFFVSWADLFILEYHMHCFFDKTPTLVQSN